MANSAADARASEQEIREKIIRAGHVDVMVAIGPNFFFTVTLPCTLWFFDKGKAGTDRADKVLFLDARHIFRQLDRAHRDFTPISCLPDDCLVNSYPVDLPWKGGMPESALKTSLDVLKEAA